MRWCCPLERDVKAKASRLGGHDRKQLEGVVATTPGRRRPARQRRPSGGHRLGDDQRGETEPPGDGGGPERIALPLLASSFLLDQPELQVGSQAHSSTPLLNSAAVAQLTSAEPARTTPAAPSTPTVSRAEPSLRLCSGSASIFGRDTMVVVPAVPTIGISKRLYPTAVTRRVARSSSRTTKSSAFDIDLAETDRHARDGYADHFASVDLDGRNQGSHLSPAPREIQAYGMKVVPAGDIGRRLQGLPREDIVSLREPALRFTDERQHVLVGWRQPGVFIGASFPGLARLIGVRHRGPLCHGTALLAEQGNTARARRNKAAIRPEGTSRHQAAAQAAASSSRARIRATVRAACRSNGSSR